MGVFCWELTVFVTHPKNYTHIFVHIFSHWAIDTRTIRKYEKYAVVVVTLVAQEHIILLFLCSVNTQIIKGLVKVLAFCLLFSFPLRVPLDKQFFPVSAGWNRNDMAFWLFAIFITKYYILQGKVFD